MKGGGLREGGRDEMIEKIEIGEIDLDKGDTREKREYLFVQNKYGILAF